MVGRAETSAVDALFGESGGTGDRRFGPTRVGKRGPEIADLPA